MKAKERDKGVEILGAVQLQLYSGGLQPFGGDPRLDFVLYESHFVVG